jgi:hypothetical protein
MQMTWDLLKYKNLLKIAHAAQQTHFLGGIGFDRFLSYFLKKIVFETNPNTNHLNLRLDLRFFSQANLYQA